LGPPAGYVRSPRSQIFDSLRMGNDIVGVVGSRSEDSLANGGCSEPSMANLASSSVTWHNFIVRRVVGIALTRPSYHVTLHVP
jgi:hypothetical protein